MRFNLLPSSNINQFYFSPESAEHMGAFKARGVVDQQEHERKARQSPTSGLLRRPLTGRLDAMKLMPSPFNNFAGANVRTMRDAINAMPVTTPLRHYIGLSSPSFSDPLLVRAKVPTDRMASEAYGLPLDLARKYIAQTNEARKDPDSLFAPVQSNVGVIARVYPDRSYRERLDHDNAFYKPDTGDGDGNYMYYAPYSEHADPMGDWVREFSGYPRYNPRAAKEHYLDENKASAFHEFGHSMAASARRTFDKKDPLYARYRKISPYHDSQSLNAVTSYVDIAPEYARIANHAKWMHARRMYDNGTPVQDINSAQAREGAAQVLRDWAADESRAYNEGGTEAVRFHNYHNSAENAWRRYHGFFQGLNQHKYSPTRGFYLERQPTPQIKLPIAATTHIPEGV